MENPDLVKMTGSKVESLVCAWIKVLCFLPGVSFSYFKGEFPKCWDEI